MAPWMLPARNSELLRCSLRLFLPIGGAITLVLLPMVTLYEHTHRQTIEARINALVQAATLRVQITFREAQANTGVVTTLPALQALLAAPAPSPELRRRTEVVFKSQLREYPRFNSWALYGPAGQLLAQANRSPLQLPDAARRRVLAMAQTLPARQFALSPVLWPAQGPAALLLARPLFSSGGQRRGVLLAVVSLAPLARDFDYITNANPALERGFLLTSEGRAINAPPGGAAVLNFAARYPQVWQQIQRQPKGAVDTGRDEGLFVFEQGPAQLPLAVVLQVPPASLYRTSAFAQPAGQLLVALLYLLAAGASVVIARQQRRDDESRELERQLQTRLQAIQRNAGVGMCLCDSQSGRFLSVNEALCSFFGRGETELLRCTWQELTHPDDLAADQALAAQLQRGELESYRLRKRFCRSDGSTVWGDLVVSCTRNADRTVRDLIGQITDVSELVAKTTYLEAAASAGVVGVWDWDVPRDVITWDAVMYRLYGRRAEDFQGTREAWEKGIHPDDKPFVLQEVAAALRGWREYQPRFRVVWPDGSIHHLQARSRTTYGPDGRPLRMIGVNYDITEQVERQQEVEQQRQLLATTLDALLDPLLVLTLEDRQLPQLCIAQVNPAAARFFACSQPQLLGQPLAELLPASLNGELHAALQAVAQGGPPLLTDTQPVWLKETAVVERHRDGAGPLLLDLCAVAVQHGLVLSFRDVSEQRHAAARLAASEERYRLLAENASDVVFRASLEGVTEWITDSVTPLLGWSPADLIQRPFAPFLHPDDLKVLQEVDAAFARGERRQFRWRVRRRDGDYHWVSVNARGLAGANGEMVGIIGSWRDAQLEVAAELELDRRARIDALTGLYNRQEILEQLERLVHRHDHPAQRHGEEGALAVLFCDIDHFKEINDRHGHAGGDAVLQALAGRLRDSTRHGDLVGRLGGDELIAVLPSMSSLEVAVAMANKVHKVVRTPLQLPTGEVVPTLSIGVTLIQPDEAIDAVVARADAAMYAAKRSGRDQVMAF